MALVLTQGTAMAEGLSGSVELSNSNSVSNAKDAAGLSSQTRTVDFFQRYKLSFDDTIYPNVFLRGAGTFEKDMLRSRTGDSETKQTSIRIIPSVSLILNNPLLKAGAYYEKREEKSGDPFVTEIRDTQSAFLGYKPAGLPTLDVLFARRHTFDREHVRRDAFSIDYSLFSRYEPVKQVDLSYRVSYSDTEDRLLDVGTERLDQFGRAAYGDFFFNGRAAFSASYSAARSDAKSTRSGVGGVRVPLFPVAGLSAISDTPLVGALDLNPALIDGNLTASSSLNIGRLPSLSGDNRKRNMGVDFGIATEVNYLHVSVDRELPTVVAGAFSWEIYISQDNQNWSLHQTVSPASFNPFENRFEIAFPNVSTRYIKAVTRPLPVTATIPPGVNVDNIFITELGAFLDRPASQGGQTTTLTTDLGDVNMRMAIVNTASHSLYYDMYYLTVRQSNQPGERSTLTNALTASQRFSDVLTGVARAQRLTEEAPNGNRSLSSLYNGSLVARMAHLPTLTTNLNLNAQRSDVDGNTTDSGSITLNNYAGWYPGISTSLSGGMTLSSLDTGQDTTSTSVNAGLSVTPHRTLLITVGHSHAETKQRISGEEQDTFTSSTALNMNYSPYSSLYFLGTIGQQAGTGKKRQTIQNYSVSWSGQQAGAALELVLTYYDYLDPEADSRIQVTTAGAKWKINRRTYLDCFYVITTEEAAVQETNTRTITTTFRMHI
jgi:hypothetical protein